MVAFHVVTIENLLFSQSHNTGKSCFAVFLLLINDVSPSEIVHI